MMMKNDLEFFILKFTKPLQRYLLTSQANSALLGRFFLHWAAATLKGLGEFQNEKILGHFSPSSRFNSAYQTSSIWCEALYFMNRPPGTNLNLNIISKVKKRLRNE